MESIRTLVLILSLNPGVYEVVNKKQLRLAEDSSVSWGLTSSYSHTHTRWRLGSLQLEYTGLPCLKKKKMLMYLY